MKDLHLNVNDDAFEIINNKKLLNKYSYSKAVEELVFNAEINNELINEFQKALDNAGIPLSVFASQEVHLTGELMDAIAKDFVMQDFDTVNFFFDQIKRTCFPFQITSL